MSITGQVLVVDDDEGQRWNQREILTAQGWEVETASDREEALARFAEDRFDVVVLDQKLAGSGGPDVGLDLLSAVPPGAKAILVSAYATRESIRAAFERDAFDFVEKGQHVDTMLVIKVEQALQLARAARMSALDPHSSGRQLASSWAACRAEQNNQRKGALLEEVIALLLRTIPGFAAANTNRRNEVEEIDVVVRNESPDPFWQAQGSYLLVECKHWSKPVGAPELSRFRGKLERRFGRTKLGFFVAIGGFAETFHREHLADRKERHLVVPVGLNDLTALIESDPRSETLKGLVDRAIIGAGAS